MTEEDGLRHLKDHLFHGLKPNLCNALHYVYDTPDVQYSQPVMALRKVETETLRSSVSEVRAKSTVMGTDTDLQVKGASSEPLYEAVTQQIAYVMSTVSIQTSQNSSKSKDCDGSKSSNGNDKYFYNNFQKPKRDKKDMKCWDVGAQAIVGESAPHPDKRIIFLLDPVTKLRVEMTIKI